MQYRQRRRPNGRRSVVQQMNNKIRQVTRSLRSPTTRVAGPRDPSVTNAVIRVTHKFTRLLTSADDGLFVVTSAILNAVVPGTSFQRYRLIKFSAYGAAAPGSYIGVRESNSSSFIGTIDRFSFEDIGTQGSIRPAIHLQPNFDFKIQWNDINAQTSSELYFIRTLPDSEIIIQYTLELETAAPTTFP